MFGAGRGAHPRLPLTDPAASRPGGESPALRVYARRMRELELQVRELLAASSLLIYLSPLRPARPSGPTGPGPPAAHSGPGLRSCQDCHAAADSDGQYNPTPKRIRRWQGRASTVGRDPDRRPRPSHGPARCRRRQRRRRAAPVLRHPSPVRPAHVDPGRAGPQSGPPSTSSS